ncbi:hypothetical protein B4U80_01175 [Leptotrombidium deliense]|uniref:Uncharacterized protein n=1 Tax=Leptotrombidium deliense TaxID=299467 RepID=A0A443RSF2_9ACAR|nr:hypothetical protein B4U80_01175 [Leptotrombidium deliense]
MRVAFPVHAIHHDTEYYPEPEQFNPDCNCVIIEYSTIELNA